jgi:hypothetical protein
MYILISPGWGDRWRDRARWERAGTLRKCIHRLVSLQPLIRMYTHRRYLLRRPLARVQGTSPQSTNQQEIMAKFNAMEMIIMLIVEFVVRVTTTSSILLRGAYFSQTNQCCGDLIPVSWVQRLHLATPPPLRSNLTDTGSIKILRRVPVMPRIRGRPRRGAAWYVAESRRKQKAKFERAMAIAARRRKIKLRTPPRVFVEEVIPASGPPSPPGHTLFMPPENWNPSTSFGSHGLHQPASEGPDPSTVTAERPYTPCYVVEEIPPEATEETKNTGQERQRHRTKEEDEDTRKESTASHRLEQPPAADWDYLNLVFDIRSKMDDQIFRLAQIDQRLDMFFAAHSRASSKKQCPTCACTYTFPARWRHSEV